MSADAETTYLRISVESVLPATAAVAGHWLVTFAIHNSGPAAVHLDEAWLPHGQFRGDRFRVDVSLNPGRTHALSATVHIPDAPLSVVENAFLILTTANGRRHTRLFVRLRVPIDADGVPRPRIEHVNSQTTGDRALE